MVLPYRGPYGPGQPGLSRRLLDRYYESNTAAYPARDPYNFRKEYDERDFLEHGEMPRSPSWNPIIDQQPLRPGDLMEGESSRQAPDPFGYQPSQQASLTPLTRGEYSNLSKGKEFWDWNARGGRRGPLIDSETGRPWKPQYQPPPDPNAPMSSLDGQQLALSENLPPAAGTTGDIYDQILRDRAQTKGFGDLRPEDPPSRLQQFKKLFDQRSEVPQETIGTHGGPSDLIAPPSPPQQDTQSVADVFGSPQSGASSMPSRREEVARMLRDYVERNPWDAASAIGFAKSKGLDATLGAPDWTPPNAGSLTPEDVGFGSRRMSSAPDAPPETAPYAGPEIIRSREGPMPLLKPARRYDPLSAATQPPAASPSMGQWPRVAPAGGIPYTAAAGGRLPDLAESDRLIEDYRESERAKAFSAMPPPASPQYDPLISPRAPSMQMPSVTATANQGPPSPAVGSYAGGFMRSPALPRPRPMDSLIAGRPEVPGSLPAAPPALGGDRVPLPRQTAALGSGERSLTPGLPQPRPEEFGPYEGPAQLADLRNGPRDITQGLIALGQESRLPSPRPDMPQDVAAPSPLIDPGRFGAAVPDAPSNPLAVRTGLRIPDDASMPSGLEPPVRTGFGNEALGIDPATGLPAAPRVAQQAPPIDPAAIAEARQTLQMHPDTGRIRTAPGFQQYNEPARLPPTAEQVARPLIRSDLTAAAAATGGRTLTPLTSTVPPPAPPQVARLPRARPPDEAMGSDLPPGPQSGLPTSVMENIARAGPAAAQLASGGPAGETLAEAAERLAAERRRQMGGTYSPTDDLIAGPEASVPPVEPVTPPPITEQQVIEDRPPLIAPSTPTPINPRLSPREIERRARERGFGTVENLTGDRWARGIGAATGVAAGLATGNPLVATGLGVRGYQRGDDIRRGLMNIFGGGLGRKDKKKNDANGTPPSSDPAGIREAAAAASRSGLGSDRYSGGSYGGYGGPLIMEGVGQRFGQR